MTYQLNGEEKRRVVVEVVRQLKAEGSARVDEAAIKARGGVEGFAKFVVERILQGDIAGAVREMDAGLAQDEGDQLPFDGAEPLTLPRYVKVMGPEQYKVRSVATPTEVRADINRRLQNGKTVVRIAESHRASLNRLQELTAARPDELMGDIEKRLRALPPADGGSNAAVA
jgi:hypothetical protein